MNEQETFEHPPATEWRRARTEAADIMVGDLVAYLNQHYDIEADQNTKDALFELALTLL